MSSDVPAAVKDTWCDWWPRLDSIFWKCFCKANMTFMSETTNILLCYVQMPWNVVTKGQWCPLCATKTKLDGQPCQLHRCTKPSWSCQSHGHGTNSFSYAMCLPTHQVTSVLQLLTRNHKDLYIAAVNLNRCKDLKNKIQIHFVLHRSVMKASGHKFSVYFE